MEGLLAELISDLRCLPGVGPKSAQRMALHLLQYDREGALRLADTLKRAAAGIGNCSMCRNLTESPICEICADDKRDSSLLCVVEGPADVVSIEQAGSYRGLYFVLLGKLSPLDGIGPEDIGLPLLEARIADGRVAEVILATSTTPEGEATAHYISSVAREHDVRASRIAYGVPLGGDLDYVDVTTLSHAISRREAI